MTTTCDRCGQPISNYDKICGDCKEKEKQDDPYYQEIERARKTLVKSLCEWSAERPGVHERYP